MNKLLLEELEQFIKKHYPQYVEILFSHAWEYLNSHYPESVSLLEEHKSSLIIHLDETLRKLTKEESGRGKRGSSKVVTYTSIGTDHNDHPEIDIIDSRHYNYEIKTKGSGFTNPVENDDEENNETKFARLEELINILPPIEYEAFIRMFPQLNPDLKIKWTMGLTSKGLKIFYRRARIRMMWDDNQVA